MRSTLAFLLLVGLVVLATAPVPGAAPPVQEAGVDVHGDALPPFAFARLGTGRFRFQGPHDVAALSPDGKTLATFGARSVQAQIALWDTATGRVVRRIGAGNFGNRIDYTPN